MKPAPFDYVRPASLDEALEALANGEGDAKPLAGGQSLVPLMNLRLARPAVLVDLDGIDVLGEVTAEDEALRIGAMVRHERLITDPHVTAATPLLAHAARWVGHRAIRTRGTIGGSLAHADPAAELPAVTMALGATFTLISQNANRSVSAADFFTGPLTTVLADDELLVDVRLPRAPLGRAVGFAELARRHGDFALVLAAAVVDPEPGRVTVIVGGASPVPYAVSTSGGPLTSQRVDDLAEQVAATCEPADDVHAPASYRRELAVHLATQALRQAAAAPGAMP